jgi:hypothetical protein
MKKVSRREFLWLAAATGVGLAASLLDKVSIWLPFPFLNLLTKFKPGCLTAL